MGIIRGAFFKMLVPHPVTVWMKSQPVGPGPCVCLSVCMYLFIYCGGDCSVLRAGVAAIHTHNSGNIYCIYCLPFSICRGLTMSWLVLGFSQQRVWGLLEFSGQIFLLIKSFSGFILYVLNYTNEFKYNLNSPEIGTQRFKKPLSRSRALTLWI